MTVTHLITIAEPAIARGTATFRWTVEPPTALYRSTSFALSFPASVALERVPRSIWWRVALACLHSQWALLRPCRVVLPVRLDPGEREFWLRMCDAQVATLEAYVGGADTARAIDLVEAGAPLEPVRPGPDSGLIAACFSGGRDSLTEAAMLQELGERPLLVTTTSPRDGSLEHETSRRRHVLEEIQRRRGLELVEVRGTLRGCWDNGFVAARYGVGVNEFTDTFLYFAAALAVAVARGARAVNLASHTEVQESRHLAGAIVEHKHRMYSAPTQRALSTLLASAGLRYGGLTYPLYQFQVQRLLESRYADLRDLQYSCWSLTAEQSACSRCDECRTVAFNLMAEGVAPREIGIDLVSVLNAHCDWRPRREEIDSPLPNALWLFDSRLVHCLQTLTPERMTEFIKLDGAPPEAAAGALRSYERMRTAALLYDVVPEPGYRAGFLEFVDQSLRGRVAAIFDEHFERQPSSAHVEGVRRSLALSDWIRAPLARPQLDRRRRPTAVRPSPVLPARPARARPPARAVPTAWVSSAGLFVGRFEAAFARAAGCAHAIACSSGANSLALALAAAGLAPGDEVIMPAFTMIAAANAIGAVGATPMLVDSDPTTWNLDVDRIADRIGARTRAIMVGHTHGQPVDADAVAQIARANDLVTIEDAAEALGAEYHGARAGSLGTVAGFSCERNQVLSTEEGGMVTTNDEQIALVAGELRDHALSSGPNFWRRFRGCDFRMSNLQAAVGLAQVERLDELLAARRQAARWFREALGGIPGLELPPVQPGHQSADWRFGILVDDDFGCARGELRQRLAAEGIETQTFPVPIHLRTAYLADQRGRHFPVAERLGRTGLYLPSGPHLGEAHIARVADAISRASTP